MTAEPILPSRLVQSLERVAQDHPLDRKLLVAGSLASGRELLRAVARLGTGWVGFQVTTPRPLALRIAGEGMIEGGLGPLDVFDEESFLDDALDGALRARKDAALEDLSEGVGFRAAVHEAVRALRLAGVGAARIRSVRAGPRRQRDLLARVLDRYEDLLRQRRRADASTVLALALERLQEGWTAASLLDVDRIYLVPGLRSRGLSRRLVEELREGGAEVLETDPVVGVGPPASVVWAASDPAGQHAYLYAPEHAPAGPKRPIELFRAASVTDELREVLRRVLARGLAWDQVEIITPDPAVYGSAMHALATRLGVPVTYAVGLPVERTRAGRVARAYLDWVEGGFQAAPIRRLLEAGDLQPGSRRRFSPSDLARRFRLLRVGWGRRRYRAQWRAALEALDHATRRKWESEAGFKHRLRRTRDELRALRSILNPALRATPSVPDRAGEERGPVAPSELARGLAAFLAKVPGGSGPDAAAMVEIVRVLDRVQATLSRRTDFGAALTILRRHIEIRVRAAEPGPRQADDRGAPWHSEGGHLHLSDIEHGGFAGRTNVFLVGFDADRIPGGGSQDPVLPDVDRTALGGGLATHAELQQERSFRVAALFARLRGQVTISYGAWDAAEARVVAPSPVLLQALRLEHRDPSLTFESLHRVLGDVACAIPRADLPPLDSDDVWMQALSSGRVLRSGVAAVRAGFPMLDEGLTAQALRSGQAGPHHGVVTPRPRELDPRLNEAVVLSASRLQDLGTCPLRYLFKGVMKLYPPDDPELDPDRWLDALQKGTVLHAVYERTLRESRARGIGEGDDALEPLALEMLARVLERTLIEVPAPGDGAVRRECARLEDDVRSFARMMRENGAPWVELELAFGKDDDEPLLLPLSSAGIRLRGAVDRVDRSASGLHVIDYKTGSAFGHDAASGAFHGGRRLQHALYAEAAERILGGMVVAGEYHFPTRKGENRIVRYGRLDLAGLPRLVDHLLDGVAAGTFVPTDNPDDCKFCDFAAVCRARADTWGNVSSPLAEWSGQGVAVGSPPFDHLRAARRYETQKQ